MRNIHCLCAASAAILAFWAAPAFAHDSLTLRAAVASDLSRDQASLSAGRTEACIVRAAPAEMPPFEQSANTGGTTSIEVDLNAHGSLTNAVVLKSSGHARLDRSALDAVRATTYQPASMDGHSIGGRYIVDVVFDPSN